MLGGHTNDMLGDILIALVIVLIAAFLGLVIHPLLWFVAILAVLFLVSRAGRGTRV